MIYTRQHLLHSVSYRFRHRNGLMEFNCEFVDREKHDVETDHDCHQSKPPSENTGARIDETAFDIATRSKFSTHQDCSHC